jgi:hypothetical protein
MIITVLLKIIAIQQLDVTILQSPLVMTAMSVPLMNVMSQHVNAIQHQRTVMIMMLVQSTPVVLHLDVNTLLFTVMIIMNVPKILAIHQKKEDVSTLTLALAVKLVTSVTSIIAIHILVVPMITSLVT